MDFKKKTAIFIAQHQTAITTGITVTFYDFYKVRSP